MARYSAWKGLIAVGIAAAAGAIVWQSGTESQSAGDTAPNLWPEARSYGVGTSHSKLQPMYGKAEESQPYELGAGITYSIGTETGAIATGDLSGDGLDDLAILASRGFSGTQLILFTQTPEGMVQSGVFVMGGPYAFNGSVKLGDLNNDARLDIVVTHGEGMSLFTSKPNGEFAIQQYADWGFGPNLGLIDVDLDGYLDVVAQAKDLTTLLTCFGDGRGGVRSSVASAGTANIYDLDVGDVTNDGLPDVAMATSLGLEIMPLGVSGFLARRTYTSAEPWAASGVAIGDFDSDGRNDVALSRGKNSPAHMWVYYQDGAGTLNEAVGLPTYDMPADTIAADLDRDGRADLLVAHPGWVRRGFYLQGDDGLEPEKLIYSVNNSSRSNRMVAADLNGDGCTDIAFVDAAVLEVRHGSNCRLVDDPRARNDLDGDGLSDLLWRNDLKTDLAMWLMDGAERRFGQGYSVGATWSVIAKGDLNGDGALDLVWSDGQHMQLWQRYGDGYQGLAMPSFPTGYRVVATGDVDGDGKADLLWRDDANTHVSLWVMDGADVRDGRAYGLSSAWRIAATGDLDGDRRMDLVLTNGMRMDLWRGARNLVWNPAPMGAYPAGWALAGSADMDGDGRDDLLWRHADLGYFVYWRMIGPQRIYGREYRVDGAWQVLQAGDYNGDGKGDVVWTNGTLMQMWASGETDGFAGLEMPGYPRGWLVQ